MTHIAVIDIGKTNAKLAIVDAARLEEIDVLTTPNLTVQGAPYPHFDIGNLWQFILNGLRQFAVSYQISAITATTHGASVVLLDEYGELATQVLDYEHEGPDQCTAEYLKLKPQFRHTGSPRLTGGLNVGAQIHWLFTTVPQLQAAVKTVVMYPQYWTYRLSGVLSNEQTSLGAHTDLWNPTEATYTELADLLGITEKMAEIRPASAVLGSITPAVAQATGLAVDTPVYCGVHDSNASLFTHLHRLSPPFSVVSTGTWVVCMSPGGSTAALDESRDTLINVSVHGRPIPSGKFMGGREYEYLSTTYGASTVPVIPEHLFSKGAFILPAVEHSNGPYPDSTYRWTTDPSHLTPQERYAVISFYLAMMTYTCLDICQSAGPIIIEGPFNRNLLFCAMLRASTGRTVLNTASRSTGTSIGAAMTTLSNSECSAEPCCLLPDDFDDVALKRYADEWLLLTEAHIRRDKQP
jgi:sugar (pentulose or hexulose) kinase